ncbi:uncharacterized protein LOC113311250 [Papaver somniferum]|uniref:uncharacterized protein LOC113311250 n=1 Tax=Papaver somniferum TaxID=3469 RepID=UPI000E6FE92A|nr:uncharacterized protein LOC113311250 [Papaver somniferum]
MKIRSNSLRNYRKLREEVQSLKSVKGDVNTLRTDMGNQFQLLQSAMGKKFQLLFDNPVFSSGYNHGSDDGEIPDPSSSQYFQNYPQDNHHRRLVQTPQLGEGQFSNYRPKIDFPRFDGTNPRTWIRKCKKYFFLHQMNDEQNVHMATLYLDGKADVWFQDYQIGKGILYWEDFIIDVCTRFQELGHDSVIGEFNKLDQTNTVLEYQERFEELKDLMLAKNPSLPEDYFIQSFISGLKEDIRLVVRMFTPSTLQQTIFLARRQECIMDRNAKDQPKYSHRFNSGSKTLIVPNKPSVLSPLVTTPIVTSPTTSPKLQPVKKLTYADMRAKREKGLCYNCDELYTKGHKCNKQQLYMIVADDEDAVHSGEMGEGSSPQIVELEEYMEISVHALAGNISPTTIKIKGFVKKHGLTILIDSGSTHSFLDPVAAKRSGCTLTPTPTLQVTVADDNKLLSHAKCAEFSWSMQGHNFSHDLHILELGGCDMVLGVDWMREKSLMVFDFKKFLVKFQRQGKEIELVGHKEEAALSQMSGTKIRKLLKKGKQGFIGHLFSLSATTPPDDIQPQIAAVLDQFPTIFQTPTSLPPVRAHDHHINLTPNASPTNLLPYRVPYIQKEVIEKLVHEMLQAGVIQPSHSPYSSPVILVKKKDGDWRFCVDYRKLNAITVKDKYLIPVIYELLAELSGSTIFSKLDLRAGYHQIRVHKMILQKLPFIHITGTLNFE